MRYRIDPVGNHGCPALYMVVDTNLSGFNTTMCTATIEYAIKIVTALNRYEEIANEQLIEAE